MTTMLRRPSADDAGRPARPSTTLTSPIIAACALAFSTLLAGPVMAASEIAQQPLINSVSGEPNVMLMMDDSNSMSWTALPAPRDFYYPSLYSPIGSPHWFAIPNNSGGTSQIHIGEINHRSPQINPLVYNPAVTYQPWNDNNKPAAANFPPAETGVFNAAGVMTQGTPHDMRTIQDGGTRIRASLGWSNLFTRGGARGGPCLETSTVVTANACLAWGPSTPLPDGGAAAGPCIEWGPLEQTVCVRSDTYPGLVEARHYMLDGTWAADRHDFTKYRMVEIDRAFPARMYPTPVSPFTGVRAQRADCANPISCTFGEESQNYANWFTYYRTRLFATIGVTSGVLSGLSTPMRLGYGRLNYFANATNPWPGYPSNAPGATLPDLDNVAHPGHIVRGVRDFAVGSTERQAVFDWLFTLNVAGGTPNREALDAAGRYFSRSDARGPWSTRPGTGPGGGAADLSCRRSYTILATDGAWTEYDASVHPRIADRYSGSGTPIESDSVAGPMLVGGGAQVGRDYQYLPGADVALSTNSSQTGTLTDVAHYYWSRDLRPDLVNNNKPTPWSSATSTTYPGGYFDPATWQNMSTMIIGYGLQPVRPNADVTAAMEANTAIAWPSVTATDPNDIAKVDDSQRAALASRGSFYAAMDTNELSKALSGAFTAIGSARASGSNIGISTAVIRDSNDLAFEASYVTREWTGTVTAIEAAGLASGTRTVRWTASAPAPASRNIVTSTSATAAVNFAWGNLSTAQQAALETSDVLDYLRGDNAQEQPAGPLRTRASVFGTFVHSTPLYSRATNFGLHRGPTAGGTDYAAYLATKNSSRPATVMVNGNDGMLHAFDAATGVERFGYVPRAAYPQLRDYARPIYDHFYLVDGQVSEGDAWLGGGWKTVVVGTGGAGPKSLFALDVTNPTSFGPSRVMFDLTDAEVPDLGHITGRVLIASTVAGRWVAITGNGIESANERAVLLVIDLATGSVLRRIDTGVGSAAAGNRNGLGPVTPVYNARRDVIGLYAGDRLGNVWKFDLSSASASDWRIATVGGGAAAPLFTATGPTGARQPISSEIRVTDHPMGGLYLAFGTGQYIGSGDVTNLDVQTMYFVRDRGDLATVSKSTLRQAALSHAATPGMVRLSGLSGPGGLDWSTHRGWYVNLQISGGPAQGERVIASPVLSSGRVIFSSFKPAQSDPCVGGGASSVYTFDLSTGMQSAVYDGEGPDVIGKALEEGLPGGIVPLYVRPATTDPVLHSIDGTALGGLAGSTRYQVGSGGITSTGTGSTCGAAGSTTTANALAVPAACAGVMPIRTWRDMR